MAHIRRRHLTNILSKASKFWPVVALLGARQSGKSTLLREQMNVGPYVTFDDEDALDDASASAKNFLQKLPRPLIIDEAQKVPKIFEGIKFVIDRNKRPGSYFLTGSSQFSAKVGVRESLTGRMGIHYLFPLTLAEAGQQEFETQRASPVHRLPTRFPVESLISRFFSGGMPVPLFTRDDSLVTSYFQSWLDTSLLRDAGRVYGKGYNPDIAFSIVQQMTIAMKEGQYASLKHFKQPSRVVRRYLSTLEEIFLVYKMAPSEATIGGDIWTFFDPGVLTFLAGSVIGDALQLSLARISILNEMMSLSESAGKRLRLTYHKTARGAPVDLIWNDCLIKISNARLSQVDYDLRPLRAAMTKLKIKNGILLWGFDKKDHEKVTGSGRIDLAPWTHFS